MRSFLSSLRTKTYTWSDAKSGPTVPLEAVTHRALHAEMPDSIGNSPLS
jgi:hypothetical protein